jgi:peptide subunit release factor RF-3
LLLLLQVLYSTDEYITDPILAAVGQLQFEVVQYRMKVRRQALNSLLLPSRNIRKCLGVRCC